MDISELKPGVVIEGPKWMEPVLVNNIEHTEAGISLIGATTISEKYIGAILTNEELRDVNLKTIRCDFMSESWKVFLALESIRYRFASDYDPLLATNTSKINPLPHQIEAVYGIVLKMPRVRFLLAHDPGAGKTIMAGLVIKEMKLRSLVSRILIVVPGHLKDQWRRELKEKFGETFMVADRGAISALYGQNIWAHQNQLITSIDFAKQDDIRSSIDASEFDLVIVDEAHKMSAYRYNEKISKTSRYKLGETLSKNTEHLLFLTATPHKGDADNFRLFLDLLEPGFFATSDMLEESIKKDENTLFLRRIKEEMKDFDGKPLFLPRHVSTTTYSLSPLERDLYRNVTDYVKHQYNKALTSDNRRNISFALIILQRRLASSSFALWKSLTRRHKKLKEILDNFEELKKPISKIFDFEEIEEMNEEERWKQEEILETLSHADNEEELKKEILTLEELIIQAKNVIDEETEVKLQKLKETMKRLESRKESSDKKILIFTESRDTLEYIEKRIKSWGYSVNSIHGGMGLDDRVEAEKIFKTQTQVLVATEAAGEGINLQFCHLMINYDIPWNPTRLEQRMGRVHRYGQKFEVYVYNLIAADTIEGRIFQRVFEKLEEIKKQMGSDKVYDIIGEIYRDKDLATLLEQAAVRARSEVEIFETLNLKVDEDFIRKIHENLGDTLLTKEIDFTQIKEQRQLARENKLIPEYTRDFFIKAFTKSEGKIRKKGEGLFVIKSIPYQIKKLAERDDFKKLFGAVLGSYPKVTFTKYVGPKDQDAEFLTFGHPLFEAVMEWIDKSFSSDLQRGAEFIDTSGQLDGFVLFYEGKIMDGNGTIAGKRLFAYYIDSKTGIIEVIHPSILWDLKESHNSNNNITVQIEDLKSKVQSKIIEPLRNYQEELQERRNKYAMIKEKYGVESLKKLIRDLDKDLVDLREKNRKDPKYDLPIHNKESRQQKYKDSKLELAERIEREKNLTISVPTFLGIILVKSPQEIQDELRKDVETEKIAMDTVMEYETKHGRKPVDVSREFGLGYDIKSFENNDDIRYIEVKGRKGIGNVALSKNEWFKAKHLGLDYYLYVVWNTEKHPDVIGPKIICDPANKINPKEDIHYMISTGDIESRAE